MERGTERVKRFAQEHNVIFSCILSFQIEVTDADLGSNAEVRFSFVPDSKKHYQLFTIDPVSGIIKTMTTFDREELGSYSLTVRVTDQPTTGQGR